uniref:Amiloride-sensitive sodium channel subunit alpha-like protein n=1 Tax=Callorhinchus milii TaxID=7868 RepID=V9KZ63_CALMI
MDLARALALSRREAICHPAPRKPWRFPVKSHRCPPSFPLLLSLPPSPSPSPSPFTHSPSPGRSSEFIRSCKFNRVSCDNNNYTTFSHPRYGTCYTLNTGPVSWRVLGPGSANGLTLTLQVGEGLRFLTPGFGVRLMVHDPKQTPILEDDGIDLLPGLETSVSLRLESVRRLGGGLSDCTKDGKGVEIENLYDSSYSQQTCVRSCFQALMTLRCNCSYFFYNKPKNSHYCNSRSHPDWGHCYYKLYEEFIAEKLNCFEKCPKLCDQSLYHITVGHSKWPSKQVESWMRPFLSNKKDFNVRKDFAKLNVYFEALSYREIEEISAISVMELLSSLGGEVSVWFGGSVLSGFELLELLLDFLVLSIALLKASVWRGH